ncbi:3'-5' exonuclease [Geobacillus kaustophilus NBRC 102445]|uniref:3'-5' exonuclease n=1 Tax=Geobacillus kaustophilus TaxID=1462 RepID=UPI0010BEB75C|nr:3'-5' exonuclease [Geobacillus kaustophilus]QCK84089.1 3'-5' exonuclease [Geobacillus kaustophilus NBRC 102445]QHB48463.1 3'-5' exonuclease family protein [Geobacillus phage GBK1]
MKIVVFDFETTGLNPQNDYPIELALLITDFKDTHKEYSSKIKLPRGVKLPPFITNLTGLTEEDLQQKGKDLEEVKQDILSLIDIEKDLFVAHNANFDLGFLYHHFGIAPKRFVCTRTIEFLTNPHENCSLKNTYARYYGEKEQTHRALDDVKMTLEVLKSHFEHHGEYAMVFFVNKIVQTPERNLVFVPENATVLDFTKKFALKEEKQ